VGGLIKGEKKHERRTLDEGFHQRQELEGGKKLYPPRKVLRKEKIQSSNSERALKSLPGEIFKNQIGGREILGKHSALADRGITKIM